MRGASPLLFVVVLIVVATVAYPLALAELFELFPFLYGGAGSD